MDKVEVVKVGKNSFDSLLGLWLEFMPVDEKTLPAFFSLGNDWKKHLRDYALKRFNRKNEAFFIIKVNGVSAGFAEASIDKWSKIFKTSKAGELKNLYIRKKFRGKKLSSILFRTVKDWFKRKNVNCLIIEVSSKNKSARKIYKHWGFEEFEANMFLLQ